MCQLKNEVLLQISWQKNDLPKYNILKLNVISPVIFLINQAILLGDNVTPEIKYEQEIVFIDNCYDEPDKYPLSELLLKAIPTEIIKQIRFKP